VLFGGVLRAGFFVVEVCGFWWCAFAPFVGFVPPFYTILAVLNFCFSLINLFLLPWFLNIIRN